jgi:hypothetical protein
MKPRSAHVSKRETAAQASAWLRTVLHPLWRMAQVTRNRLESGSLTYRQHTRDFELLAPSAGAVSPVYRLNLEQAGRYLPELLERVRAYDDALGALREACRQADALLRVHPRVAAAADAGASTGVGDLRAYLSEYTVNGHRELPTQYALRELWAREGPGLLALRQGELAAAFEPIAQHADALRQAAGALDDYLRRTMLDVADRHGLPPVDPEALAS